MKTAYIIQGFRTAVGKAPKGVFRFKRSDELAAETIKHLLKAVPQLEVSRIDDVMVGCAMPEGAQGLNMGRLISLMGLNTIDVPGVTVNRFCSSGLETIAMATAKIASGMADCIIAGGAESMSSVPMGGYKPELNYDSVKAGHEDYYWGMGTTAEAVANKYSISREDQDLFSFNSHQKALKAIKDGIFKQDIVPITVNQTYIDASGKRNEKSYIVDTEEGPRADTSLEVLAKLRPVFAQGGSVTAGNSSQMSDGAAFVLVMSEAMVKELNLEPIARLVSYVPVGVEPSLMGIGPMVAIPKALKRAGLDLKDINLIELNEAFASQSLAVMRGLKLNPDIVNVNGGAIAMGHPLGCTGAKLSVQIFNELRRRKQKYGIVTMCVGTGQGAAGIYELLS
ncbi:MAG: acetyl-CoA C-acyltransferase [Flavobacteriales bacterium CG_4_9_14_0_2_um_filter_35_242]|nr:acetyl-CoA C-acyltransferase [Zetaproteobacteria bacterium]OIO12666.1 MAG: acetyl-CoA acetyltransferase [Flavobacteriaceae bacterium CG1_02_35_72]PIR12492.1 MAG: acetyl-CoA C-acyltransferase [Flavobacteriales bacterium CG11_big_fil_rev_8_21_14_0_20_35_7]PIX07878.1 MAG: acetyl-CoA C-acyltransferase [Flavobacteriales bacterium CG_4_8_14_3_um_filter_35_10]PJA04696.1 MAG: acetyl-CoA C-acyltransferase [Flavobacteriales bacterium CG_4_10_14_0_2_um_filter_35_18]PJC59588.1 MAG: acetyl-CoA C-acyltra